MNYRYDISLYTHGRACSESTMAGSRTHRVEGDAPGRRKKEEGIRKGKACAPESAHARQKERKELEGVAGTVTETEETARAWTSHGER
jgi:hypothetical protein